MMNRIREVATRRDALILAQKQETAQAANDAAEAATLALPAAE